MYIYWKDVNITFNFLSQVSANGLHKNNVGDIVRDWAVDLVVMDVPSGQKVLGFYPPCPSWNEDKDDYWKILLMFGKALLQNDGCIVFLSSSTFHDKQTRTAIKRFTGKSEFNHQFKQWVCINTLPLISSKGKVHPIIYYIISQYILCFVDSEGSKSSKHWLNTIFLFTYNIHYSHFIIVITNHSN